MAETTAQERVAAYRERLLASRNGDGSWPYRKGIGLGESTCLALLALRAAGDEASGFAASVEWLETLRREDGGYAPQAAVGFSNWVTILASIVMLEYGREDASKRAVEWMLGQTGIEARWVSRLTRTVGNSPAPYPQRFHGWPWVGETNAWVSPTALAAVALLRAERVMGDARIRERVEQAEGMLLDRRCADGGWNYGAPEVLEVKATSYPETTGMALVGLQTKAEESMPGAVALAQTMLAETRVASAASWLQLALSARGIAAATGEEGAIQCRNTHDLALRILALRALEGNNIFKA